MSRSLVSVCFVFVAGCASSAGDFPGLTSSPVPAAPAHAEETSAAVRLADVREVEISDLTDDTVCRREKPTGSRIAVERCRSTNDPGEDKVANQILRQDVQQMRNQQILQQQLEQSRDRAIRQQAMQR